MKNKHGLECPIPLEQWPDKAQWCAIDKNGTVDFFSHRPIWDSDGDFWDRTFYGRVVGTITITQKGGRNHVWHRSELNN